MPGSRGLRGLPSRRAAPGGGVAVITRNATEAYQAGGTVVKWLPAG
ncbi:MAG: hypothetical protein JXQ99_23125 [Hyphomicrobiaceae bacterium]